MDQHVSIAVTTARETDSKTSGVTLSPVSRHKLSIVPGISVITKASGDSHTNSAAGVNVFQPLMVRPFSTACNRDSESNCARTSSTFGAASGLYSLIRKLLYVCQIGCRFCDRT